MFENWHLLEIKTISSHAYKAGPWYLQGIPFKISDEHPRHPVTFVLE